MTHTPLAITCAILTILLIGVAAVTDLKWRRIPNFLTFPAFAAALLVRTAYLGWSGLLLAIAGAVIAPVLLLLFHGGKGLGMGDLKLAAAVGALVGPMLAAVAMLLSAVAGGILAIAMMLRSGGLVAQILGTFLIGLPFSRKKKANTTPTAEKPRGVATMPYGLAIGVGSLMTLAVCWWTGHENWFLSFVGIAGNP